LCEKRHWENQIVALGGANYRRNVAMLDDDGREVPGTKGYKYFGRAKDLPGVRELFQSRKNEEEEENQALAFYKKFMNQGPAYYGDLDENDGTLLEFEQEAEQEVWEEAYSNLREALHLSPNDPIPKLPRSSPAASLPQLQLEKRKAGDETSDVEMTSSDGDPKPAEPAVSTISSGTDLTHMHAQAAASYIPFLQTESLLPPKMPTREEMEAVLLGLRKKILVEEYFGGDGAP